MTDLFRLSGAGNDFLALAEPERLPGPEAIRAWCTRGLSLGADGLFILSRRAGTVVMDYFNADGRPAELCLNGTRCAARLAFELGWAEGEVALVTGAGPVTARAAGATRVAVELPLVAEPPRELTVELDGRLWEGLRTTVGVPHLVLPWAESLAAAPVATVGPRLRRHPAFGGDGANVNFVRFAAPERMEIRTYERGVEAETLACGTGVVAAAAVGLLIRRVRLPAVALTRGGHELEVDAETRGRRMPKSWTLTGDARLLARLTATPEAASLPPRPPW